MDYNCISTLEYLDPVVALRQPIMTTKQTRKLQLDKHLYKTDRNVRLYHGNILEIADLLPSHSVHMMVTSVPYWGLRDYGEDTACDWPDGWYGQLGMEPDPQMFIRHMVLIFKRLYRVLRNDGTLWLNIGDTYSQGFIGRTDSHRRNKHGVFTNGHQMPGSTGGEARVRKAPKGYKRKCLMFMPHELAIAMRNDGWYARSEIIFAKKNPLPERGLDRPVRSHEFIFLFSKKPHYFYDREAIREKTGKEASWGEYQKALGTNTGADSDRYSKGYRKRSKCLTHPNGHNKRDVWPMNTEPYPESHFATFPLALPRTCILAGTSEKGVCANCGSPLQRVMSPASGGTIGHDWNTHEKNNRPTKGNTVKGGKELYATYNRGETLNWKKTCGCKTKKCKPAVVLDPFSGAATTGVVALQQGRRYIGIDVKKEYLDLSWKRLQKECDL